MKNSIFTDVYLVEFKEEFIENTYNWIIREEHQKYFLSSNKITREKNRVYWKMLMKRKSSKAYAIFLQNEHIGNCGFKNILEFKAELWIYLGDEKWKGRGNGEKALKRLLEKGGRELDIKYVELYVAKFNCAAISLYKKMGFIEKENASEDWKEKEVFCMEKYIKKGNVYNEKTL